MKIDLLKIVSLINTGMAVAESIQGAKGVEKHQAVVDGLKVGLPAVEGAVGQDLLNDAAFGTLVDQYIIARVQYLKTKDALAHLIAAKQAAAPPVP